MRLGEGIYLSYITFVSDIAFDVEIHDSRVLYFVASTHDTVYKAKL